MCTNYDELTTKWQKRRFWLFKKRRFWKILRIELDELNSIYYTYKWKIGLNEAVQQNIWFDLQPYPKATKQNCIDSRGSLGIHVHLKKSYAQDIREPNSIIVPVWGHKDDFVHADEIAGLFTQVELKQKDWDKYVKPHLLRAKVI